MGGRGGKSSGGSSQEANETLPELEPDSLAQKIWEGVEQAAGIIEKPRKKPGPKPGTTRQGGAGKGQIWLKRLAQSQGEGVEVRPVTGGYRVSDREGEVEIKFYPGFTLEQLPTDVTHALGLEIVQSRGLQRMLVEYSAEKPITIIKRLWSKWQRGLETGRLHQASFTEYVGRNGYQVASGAKSLIAAEIKNWEELSERERAETLLRSSEPDLLENLPAHLKAEVEDLLAKTGIIARTRYLEDARLPLIKRLNQRLGYHLRDLPEFEQVMGVVRQNSSRGAVGEVFARRFVVGELTASLERRKPHFPKELYGGEQAIQPDMLRPSSRRTLDVKVGYAENNIDDLQLKRYMLLVRASNKPSNQALKSKLETFGVAGGKLAGHDYLFLPDKNGRSKDAAINTFQKVRAKRLEDAINVFYIEQSEDNSKRQSVFILATSEDGKIVSRLIGERLPD